VQAIGEWEGHSAIYVDTVVSFTASFIFWFSGFISSLFVNDMQGLCDSGVALQP
jgi:hypothetical protein